MAKISNNKSSQNHLFINKLDKFSVSFSEYFTNPLLKKISQHYNEKKYTVGQTDVAYRVISHWDEYKLLPSNTNRDTEWRKFSLVEIIWIKIIQRFRIFGFSLEKIAIVRKWILDLDEDDGRYPLLEYYIARAKLSSDDPYIICMPDGFSQIATMEEFVLSKMTMGNVDTLLISIKSILEEIGLKVPESEVLFSLNKEELNLLESIRLEDNKEIKAKLANGKITEIETAQIYQGNPPLEEINKELRDSESFAEITTRYVKGAKRSSEVRKKRKLS